jgi:O-antigen/teichoic acid export membrane protein
MIGGDNRQSTPEINRYYNSLTAVVMVLIGVNVFVIPLAIEWFVHKPDYRLSIQYIPYIAVLYVFRVMRLYFAVPYSTLKYTKPLPVIYTVVIAVKIGLMFVLTASLGIYGLLMASGVSSIVEIFMQKYLIQAQFTYRYNPYKLVIAPIVLMIVVSAVEFSFVGTIPAYLLHLLYLLLCFILLVWVYRHELKSLNWREVINRSST